MFHKINKQLLITTTYLLRDGLKLMILALILILIAEAVLPGIITDRINITYIFILTILLYFFQEKLTDKFDTEVADRVKKRSWIAPVAISVYALLIVRSLIKFEIWQIALIALGTTAVSFLIYKEIFNHKK
jgi:hypothetical protein